MRRLIALFLVLAAAVPAVAQETSSIDGLLARARRALDDLDYPKADSIARSLLDVANPEQRVAGMQILAAALYPEEAAARQPDSAVRYLQDLVRATPDASIPREVTWGGLDSLLEAVRGETFAVWAAPEGTYEVIGPDGEARIEVAASKPARFVLTTELVGSGVQTVVDSAGPAPEATLHLRALVSDRPVLAWGDYALRIVATDTLTGEQQERVFPVRVEAPPFALLAVPAALDSSLLVPERAPRRSVRNGLLGLGLGAATAFVASSFGGGDEVGSASHSRSVLLVGTGMALGALVGAVLDPGHAIPENVEANRDVRTAFAEYVRDLRAENERRRIEYRATVVIEPGRGG